MASIINIQNPATSLDGQVVVEYNGLVLQIVRTEEWLCEPELDYSGVDYCTNHIILGVRAYVNPFATATVPGRRAGLTMADVQTILMAPRGQLIYRIGQDVVVSSPLQGAVCDAKNGPKPLACKIIEVKGVKTAVIFFRIETWISGPSPILSACPTVLSNRWSVEADVGDDWKTTIITRGRMRVRTDAMQTDDPPSPDVFRSSVLPLPIPDTFKRTDVDVTASEDGTELLWSCVDRQQSLNLINGADLGVIDVDGEITTGVSLPYHDIKSYGSQMVSNAMSGGFKGALAGGFGGPIGIFAGAALGALGGAFLGTTPDVFNSFRIKLIGPPPLPNLPPPGGFNGNSRLALLRVGIAIILDRFKPILPFGLTFANGNNAITKGGLVSLFATVSIKDVIVELRGEVLGTLSGTFNPTDFGTQFNISDDMTGAATTATLTTGGQAPVPDTTKYQGVLNFKGATGSNPNPPNGNTSRGLFIGALLEQALKGQFDLPDDNATSVGSEDVDEGGFE